MSGWRSLLKTILFWAVQSCREWFLKTNANTKKKKYLVTRWNLIPKFGRRRQNVATGALRANLVQLPLLPRIHLLPIKQTWVVEPKQRECTCVCVCFSRNCTRHLWKHCRKNQRFWSFLVFQMPWFLIAVGSRILFGSRMWALTAGVSTN